MLLPNSAPYYAWVGGGAVRGTYDSFERGNRCVASKQSKYRVHMPARIEYNGWKRKGHGIALDHDMIAVNRLSDSVIGMYPG